jgi:hypothetical protein
VIRDCLGSTRVNHISWIIRFMSELLSLRRLSQGNKECGARFGVPYGSELTICTTSDGVVIVLVGTELFDSASLSVS